MFDPTELAVAIHVLLAGLWIGADIGAFLSFRRALDAARTVESRTAMARFFTWINTGPRAALAVTFGLGIYLTYDRGFGFRLGSWRLAAFVAIAGSVMWLCLVCYLHWVNRPRTADSLAEVHRRYANVLTRIEFGWSAVVAVFLLGAGIGTVQSKSPALLNVLGWKMVMLSGVVVAAALVRFRVSGVLERFGVIVANGSSPEREVELRKAAAPVQALIVATWVLLFLMVWASVTDL